MAQKTVRSRNAMQFLRDTTRKYKKGKGNDDGNFTRISFGAWPRQAQPCRDRSAAGRGHCGHSAALAGRDGHSGKRYEGERAAAARDFQRHGREHSGSAAHAGRSGRQHSGGERGDRSGLRQCGQHGGYRSCGRDAGDLRPGPADGGRLHGQGARQQHHPPAQLRAGGPELFCGCSLPR